MFLTPRRNRAIAFLPARPRSRNPFVITVLAWSKQLKLRKAKEETQQIK